MRIFDVIRIITVRLIVACSVVALLGQAAIFSMVGVVEAGGRRKGSNLRGHCIVVFNGNLTGKDQNIDETI